MGNADTLTGSYIAERLLNEWELFEPLNGLLFTMSFLGGLKKRKR
jgi:hypothetical protein